MNTASRSIAFWYAPTDTPVCAEGGMVPVILQRRGKVFGGWYANKYPLYDEYDSLGDDKTDDGLSLATGFCEKLPHDDYDEYYQFGVIHDLQCWAHMPEPKEI